MAKIILQSLVILTLMFTTLFAEQAAEADSFAKLKLSMADAGCNRFEFLSVLHSDIFDSIDSSFGSIVISNNGLFRLDMERDIILFDGSDLYTYSLDNNQVTIENQKGLNSDNETHKQITFITNLDKYYLTKVVKQNLEYTLIGKKLKPASLPDSLNVFLSQTTRELDRLKFYDINEDLNQFIFKQHEIKDYCDSTNFIPSFPDSVDVVRFQ